MKRYVKELASDFRKWMDKERKKYPMFLPAGFLWKVNHVEKCYMDGLITSREAVKEITMLWDSCEEWIQDCLDASKL